ncbi:MAG: hypothetical protein HC820_02780 [Hydrococcus sp. RM1_1_31]|nr:hypothetical protein [Hydrococcus sp. RM1_1_31]
MTQNVDVSGTGEVFLRGENISLRNTVLRTDEGIARINGSGNLETKRWQTLVTANSFALTPFLSPICNQNPAAYCSYLTTANPTLETANVSLSGRLDNFNPDTLQGIANLTVRLDRGFVAVRSELSKGAIEATANASQIALNPLLPDNIAAPISISRSRIKVSGAIADLLEGSTVAARNFDADIEALLNVAGGTVSAAGELQDGILEATATSGRIALTELLPNLPIATQVRDSRVRLTGNVAQLVASLEESPDLSSFRGTADIRLGVANGIVNTLTQLNNNRWTTNIVASDLNTQQILAQLPNTKNFSQQDIPNLNGLINLSGPVAPLLQPNTPLPIQANTIALQLQQQTLNLNANGALLISNLFSSPDIASVNLNVKANSTLDRLPLTELLAQVPVRRSLLPRELDVTGDGQFQGRFAGRNLISAPTAPGNILLSGNLRLEDFTLNDRPFDPVLAGPVTIALGRENRPQFARGRRYYRRQVRTLRPAKMSGTLSRFFFPTAPNHRRFTSNCRPRATNWRTFSGTNRKFSSRSIKYLSWGRIRYHWRAIGTTTS